MIGMVSKQNSLIDSSFNSLLQTSFSLNEHRTICTPSVHNLSTVYAQLVLQTFLAHVLFSIHLSFQFLLLDVIMFKYGVEYNFINQSMSKTLVFHASFVEAIGLGLSRSWQTSKWKWA